MALPHFTEGAYHPTVTADARKNAQDSNEIVLSTSFPHLLDRLRTRPEEVHSVALQGLQFIGHESGGEFRLTYKPPERDINGMSFSFEIGYEDEMTPFGSYTFKLTEEAEQIRISAFVNVAAHAQGNGYGTALLKHDVDMLHAVLIAHGYHNRDIPIFVTIVDGAEGYHGLEELNPYYDRANWTSMRVGEYLTRHYISDRETIRRYTSHGNVTAVHVIKDPARGIDNLSEAS